MMHFVLGNFEKRPLCKSRADVRRVGYNSTKVSVIVIRDVHYLRNLRIDRAGSIQFVWVQIHSMRKVAI